jgi:hypothetical protein
MFAISGFSMQGRFRARKLKEDGLGVLETRRMNIRGNLYSVSLSEKKKTIPSERRTLKKKPKLFQKVDTVQQALF